MLHYFLQFMKRDFEMDPNLIKVMKIDEVKLMMWESQKHRVINLKKKSFQANNCTRFTRSRS